MPQIEQYGNHYLRNPRRIVIEASTPNDKSSLHKINVKQGTLNRNTPCASPKLQPWTAWTAKTITRATTKPLSKNAHDSLTCTTCTAHTLSCSKLQTLSPTLQKVSACQADAKNGPMPTQWLGPAKAKFKFSLQHLSSDAKSKTEPSSSDATKLLFSNWAYYWIFGESNFSHPIFIYCILKWIELTAPYFRYNSVHQILPML